MSEESHGKCVVSEVCGWFLVFGGALMVLSGCTQTSPPLVEAEEPQMDLSQYAAQAKLKPKAQEALDKVLAKGLVEDRFAFCAEDISPFLEDASMETKYVLYALTENKVNLDDCVSILRLYVMPGLCYDLDELLHQDPPREETLDHAVWMATKLELLNLMTFLVYMGAPADKYELYM